MAYYGIAGIDNCSAGPGSCGVNCGTVCDDNEWQWAWPHFTECNGLPCNANTGAPFYSNACGTNGVRVTCVCTGRAPYPIFKDCGPPARSAYDPYCRRSGTLSACVNSLTFSYMCLGCNPITYGLISFYV